MISVNTSPLPRSISSLFRHRVAGVVAEVIFLLAVGMIAMTIHSKLRVPLQLPGRQGVLFLCLVVVGRGLTQYKFAATVTCSGSAILLATGWLGFREPMMPVFYVALGFILDMIFLGFRNVLPFVIATALSCSLGWMAVPLLKLVIGLFTGFVFTSLRSGLAWPVLTHLVFGLAGGLLGAGILNLSALFNKKN